MSTIMSKRHLKSCDSIERCTCVEGGHIQSGQQSLPHSCDHRVTCCKKLRHQGVTLNTYTL
jgi:hypothetical protein